MKPSSGRSGEAEARACEIPRNTESGGVVRLPRFRRSRNQAGPSLANLGTLRQKRRPPGGGLRRSAMSGSGRPLERDDFSSNRHPALSFWLSMIFSENRFPPRIKRGAAFFRIIL